MSSKSNEWETPDDFFKNLNKRYGFTVDAAATPENSKCEHFFTNEVIYAGHIGLNRSGLNNSWEGESVYLNPPYGKEIGLWIKKAYQESKKDTKPKVVLIPARTDTKYFSNYCSHAANLFFVQGRLKFDNRSLPSWKEDGSHKKSPATFPSVVVVFQSIREGNRNVQWCNKTFSEFW